MVQTFEQALLKAADILPVIRIVEVLEGTGKGYAIDPVVFRGCMRGQFRAKDRVEWRKNAKETNYRHYTEVKEVLREEGEQGRLLEYEVDGSRFVSFWGKKFPEWHFRE